MARGDCERKTKKSIKKKQDDEQKACIHFKLNRQPAVDGRHGITNPTQDSGRSTPFQGPRAGARTASICACFASSLSRTLRGIVGVSAHRASMTSSKLVKVWRGGMMGRLQGTMMILLASYLGGLSSNINDLGFIVKPICNWYGQVG